MIMIDVMGENPYYCTINDLEEDPYTTPYGEVPICGARANVMTYDDMNRKWIPSGSSPGLSKVQIYQHTVNSTFRVVGRKLQDHEVVINCAILKNLKYNQATPTFHQWRDSRHVYGLNFANKEDSETFANAMLTALDTLNNQGQGRPMPPPNPPPTQPPSGFSQQPPQYQPTQPVQPNGPPQTNEDNRTSRPEFQNHRRYPSGGAPVPYNMPQTQPEPVQQAPPVAPTPPAAPAPPAAPPAPPAAPAAPPAPPAPPAAPAAPPAPPPPPVPSSAPGAPPPPGPPPAPGGGPPPAPPPPAPSASSPDDGGGAPTGLAAALAARQKKLKKVETSEPDAGAGGAANKPPIGGGPMDHMNELQRKIAMRATKANTEDPSARNVSPSPTPTNQNRESAASTAPKPWEKSTNGNKITNGTGGSPKLPRRDTSPAKKWGTLPSRIKRNPSIGGPEMVTGSDTSVTTSATTSAISNTELEAFKQEILTEMRKEINKMKQEILEAIRESPR